MFWAKVVQLGKHLPEAGILCPAEGYILRHGCHRPLQLLAEVASPQQSIQSGAANPLASQFPAQLPYPRLKQEGKGELSLLAGQHPHVTGAEAQPIGLFPDAIIS